MWKKYLPVIRILIKRSAAFEQILDLNRIDFEKASGGRKGGHKFNIEFTNGKATNITGSNEPAKSLVTVLTEDDITKTLLLDNNYVFTLTLKFQLHIKNANQQNDGSVTRKKNQENSVNA
jgi:hypothetical protein